ERVPRKPVADDLRIDASAARLGVFEFLQHHHPGPLTHNEAVAVAVIRPRGALGLIVEIGRERAASGEARNRQSADGRLRHAREHHIGIAERDKSGSIADGMRAGRACRDHGMVRTFQPMLDRDIAGGEIDQTSGYEKRADATRALLGKQQGGLLDALQAADTRYDQSTRSALYLTG